MSTEQANDTSKDVWAEDRLGRKPYPDFLTNYLRNRCVTERDGTQTLTPYCISIDAKYVPRVADGVAAFDRMLGTARQLAAALDGVLVDAQRAALADAMIAAIRAKKAELQQRMNDGGSVPGSVRALRLFS